MLLIPAIDLKDGHCVRLRQGDMTKDVTVFSEEPVVMARYWREQGARRLHIVDLNAAPTVSKSDLAALSNTLLPELKPAAQGVKVI